LIDKRQTLVKQTLLAGAWGEADAGKGRGVSALCCGVGSPTRKDKKCRRAKNCEIFCPFFSMGYVFWFFVIQ